MKLRRRKYRGGSRLDQTEEESSGLWRKCGGRKVREPRLLSLASGFAKALDGNKLHHAARRGNRAGTSQDGHCPHKACAVDAEKFGEFRLRHAEFFIAPELSLRRILKEEQKNGRQSRDRFRKREAARCKEQEIINIGTK